MKNLFSATGGLLQTPIGVILTINAIWHAVMWAAGIPINWTISIILIGVEFAAAFFLLDRLTYFYSQFILPIQNPKHRREIYNRVRVFEMGERGPTLFVKNGKIIMHEGEDKKRGPGLIVLDTASALVLRTDSEIKDTAGPGIKFTTPNEYVAGSVDLRAQLQYIGPLPDDQFDSDSPEARPRREATSGLTRDGFVVAPSISVKFGIKKPLNKNIPTESGVYSGYGFDENAVRNAITREVMHLDAQGNPVRMEWNKLPTHLVVNLWREYIRKFKLSDLFTMGMPENGLQIIEDMINKRVKNPDVIELDDTGLRTNRMQPSLEFQQLQARGLEIMEVQIHNIFFDESLENNIVDQWRTGWQINALNEEKQLKEIESLINAFAREDASKKFVTTSTSQYAGKVPNSKNPFVALQLLIRPIKDDLVNGNYEHSEVGETLRKLESVWKWVLDNSGDSENKP
ncbi:MAG: hypothetical protein MUO77_07260 [Anaerolineales bacterium]|nr:hypothetical protein [Anaerolineales bacterium]